MHRVALSIKQPWATLVVLGIKRVEIRRWSTKRTGDVFIHAGRLPDRREEAWELVTPEMAELVELRGGLIGRAELIDCRVYRSPRKFSKDARLHRNPPSWFQPPRMYGFEFRDPRRVDFEAVKGALYFFPLD